MNFTQKDIFSTFGPIEGPIFIKDPKGNVFPLRKADKYFLTSEGKVKVKVRQGVQYNDHEFIVRVSYALMFHRVHETVKGAKITLISVDEKGGMTRALVTL